MKKKFITLLCVLALSCAVSTSASADTNRESKNDLTQTNVTETNSSEKNVIETSTIANNIADEIKVQETSSEAVKVEKIEQVQNLKNLEIKDKYSFRDINKLSNEELIELATQISWEDISDLFKYNSDTYAFYSNEGRIQAVIDGLYEKAQTYTADDDKGIDTLVEILRSGFYLGYYNDSLKYINERSFQDKCIPAMIAIEENENFKLGKKGQDTVINALAKLIGNASCDADVVNKTVPILEQYYNEMKQYPKDKLKGDAVYNIMKQIKYDMEQYDSETRNHDPKNTPWSGKIDSFIDSISKFASIEKITNDNDWLINNGIYYTGKFAKYHSNPSIPHEVIDKCLELYPVSSKEYFTTLDTLKYDFDSKDSKGNSIDIESIIEKQKDVVLPKTYSFDDGKMIIKAGDKVSEEKIQRLYWASKEVKAQFHRVIENDKPLEDGNADDVLTMVIYNNPEEYKLNQTLYGYSTDNGGIYIEQVGTFFTYERTPEESIYSLEELFRHEFTHYLQGRYLVPGLFNEGDFYVGDNSSRLTWFQEGTAEFFAGSTKSTVKPRKSMVGGIAQDPNDRFSASKLLHSKYEDGWDFYKYGYTFSDYMYNDNKKLFKDLVDTMKVNDVRGYESLIENASRDSRIDKDYKKNMEELYDNYDNYDTPLVSDDYMKNCPNKNLAEIKSDIENSMNLRDSKITTESSDDFNTYTLTSKYTLASNRGEIANWNEMNNKINGALDKLNNSEWKGYKTVTAYFSNPKVNAYNQVEYDVEFHGLLSRNKIINESPTIKMQCPEKSQANQEIAFSSEGSSDDGQIVSYNWDFGDETTSTEKNPTHVYKNAGDYTVKLIITDDKGLTAENTINISISKTLVGNAVFEKEDNNTRENANIIHLNDLVTGNITEEDSEDIFSFNVTKPGEVTITLEKTNKENSDYNWLLYDDTESKKYIAYPDEIMNQLTKTVTIDKCGKYYLVVYQGNGEKTEYRFNIEGTVTIDDTDTGKDTDAGKDTDKDKTSVNEKEDNSSFKNANRICKNQLMNATLDASDARDTYYFDALTAGTIDVTLENNSIDNSKVNWIAYNSEDTNKYIGYPSKTEGKKMSGSFEVKNPGRYYIVAYKNDGGTTNYTLNVNGDIEEVSNNKEINETEDNNSFKVANEVKLSSNILGELSGEDNTDMYSFDVTEAKDLDIKLKKLDNLDATWLLYNESDLNQYVAYGVDEGSSIIGGKYNAAPGKYYLRVYKYSDKNGKYSVTIK